MSSSDEFPSLVRDALHHLYDYHYLEDHPLALQFWPEAIPGGPSRARRFNRLLLETIEELNPPGAPSKETSRARYYSILVYRYVEEWDLADILRELSYSRSQFFREQRKAITMLASSLREKLPSEMPASAQQQDEGLHTEAERLLAQRERVDPGQVIQGVVHVLSQLANQYGVTLEYNLDARLPPVYGSRTLLRQVLLETLGNLITQPGARRVVIQMHQAGQEVITELTTEFDTLKHRPETATSQQSPDLNPVRHLVEMMNGQWQDLKIDAGSCCCRFSLPAEGERILLVVEDNEAIIRAFRGYLDDYNYQVVGATSGAEALRLARETNPTAITLDVMMPAQDGWEILQALKNDPVTRNIPVIICSVLQDFELASSLGAAAYLRKPVVQADLLSALDSLPVTS